MVTTYQALLRLHVEAVWNVRLPPIEQNDVSLLPGGHRPYWKLCAAAMDGNHVHIWRPDASASEREALLKRVNWALLPCRRRVARDTHSQRPSCGQQP